MSEKITQMVPTYIWIAIEFLNISTYLFTLSDADIAVALVIPSFARLSRMFSRLADRSMMFSLSLELDSPLSVLSALASEAPLLAGLLLARGSLGLAADMFGLGGTELGAA